MVVFGENLELQINIDSIILYSNRSLDLMYSTLLLEVILNKSQEIKKVLAGVENQQNSTLDNLPTTPKNQELFRCLFCIERFGGTGREDHVYGKQMFHCSWSFTNAGSSKLIS